jgi:hypothetical protein
MDVPQMSPDQMGTGASNEQDIQSQLDAIDQADQMDNAGVDTSTLPDHVMQSPDPMEAHLAHIEQQLQAIDQADQMHELAQGPGLQKIIEQSNQSMQDTMGGYTQVVSDSITQSLDQVNQGIAANNTAITEAISAMASKVDDAITMASMKDTTEATPGVTPAQLNSLVKEIKTSIGSLAGKLQSQPIDLGPITERLKTMDASEAQKPLDLTPFVDAITESIDALPSKMPKPTSPDMENVVRGLKKVQDAIEGIRIPVAKNYGAGGGKITGAITGTVAIDQTTPGTTNGVAIDQTNNGVTNAVTPTQSGGFSFSISSVGNGPERSTFGYSACALYISGTYAGCTIKVEIENGLTQFFTVPLVDVTNDISYPNGTIALTNNAQYRFWFDLHGGLDVRVSLTARTSGTVDCLLVPTNHPSASLTKIEGAGIEGGSSIGGPVKVGAYYSSDIFTANEATINSLQMNQSGAVKVIADLYTGVTGPVKGEDGASANGDLGIAAMVVRKDTPGNTSGTNGDYEMLQVANGRLWASATIDAALPAGTNLLGKVGIDQTTPGTTNAVDIQAQYDDVSPAIVSENSYGSLRISANRNLYTVLRDGTGSERSAQVDANNNLGVVLAAETTKVLGVTRTADGAGNLLTSNSTTPTAKFALDSNITSILGTAPSAAGKLDVKGADGDVFVRQATAANLNATVVGTGTFAVQADTEMPAAAALADDTANPTTTSVGTLAMVYDPNDSNWDRMRAVNATLNQAAADSGILSVGLTAQFDDTSPTAITENSWGNLRVSTNRNLYSTLRDAAGNERGLNITSRNSALVEGPTASGVSIAAAPLTIGGQARTTNPTAVTDGQVVNTTHDKLGKLVSVGSLRDLKTTQQTTITSSTSETTVLTAVASTFLDVYGVIIANTSATACDVTFKDSTAGTTRFNIYVPAGETRGFMLNESAGHNQATVNNNWTATCGTSVASIKITMLAVKNT